MSRTIRVDDEIYALIKANKRPGETKSDTVARLLKEAAAENEADFEAHRDGRACGKTSCPKCNTFPVEEVDNSHENLYSEVDPAFKSPTWGPWGEAGRDGN